MKDIFTFNPFIKMKIPKLHVIDFAGFIDLKDDPYYESKSVLNVDDYPEAGLIAEEIRKRCNCHDDLLELLEQSVTEMQELVIEIKALRPGSYRADSTIRKAKEVIRKVKGL